jgi:hypothetical protein
LSGRELRNFAILADTSIHAYPGYASLIYASLSVC